MPALYRARRLGLAVLAWALSAPAMTIGGLNYGPSGLHESVNVPFTAPNGVATAGVYSGYVLLDVSGTGFSHFSDSNDAFYLFTGGAPDAISYYQLAVDDAALPGGGGDPPRDAKNFIVFDVDSGHEILGRPYTPAYRPDHTYSFVINAGLLPSGNSPGHLYLGVSDGAFNDNGGSFNITVTQLTSAPEPVSGGLLAAVLCWLAWRERQSGITSS